MSDGILLLYRVQVLCRKMTGRKGTHIHLESGPLADRRAIQARAKAWADRHIEVGPNTGRRHRIEGAREDIGLLCRVCGRRVVDWQVATSDEKVRRRVESHLVSALHQDAEYEKDWINELAETLTTGFKDGTDSL